MAGRQRRGSVHSGRLLRNAQRTARTGRRYPGSPDVAGEGARSLVLLARLCHAERGSSGLCDGLIWPNDGCASIG